MHPFRRQSKPRRDIDASRNPVSLDAVNPAQRTAVIAAASVVGIGIYLAWDWQPVRQVEKANVRFLRALENRNWEKVRDLMATDYRDQWGLDRGAVIQNGSEALAQFFFLTLTPSEPTVALSDSSATLSCRIKVQGSGSGLAQMIMDHVNSLEGDFMFEWRRESWKPWDWRLYCILQPNLSIPSEFAFP
jgi:hypothetical protein